MAENPREQNGGSALREAYDYLHHIYVENSKSFTNLTLQLLDIYCNHLVYDDTILIKFMLLFLYRIGMRGRELMSGVGKTMMQSGGTFGTFMAIGMGIRC